MSIETITAHLTQEQAKDVSDLYEATVEKINFRDYSKEECIAMINALADALKADIETLSQY